MYKTEYLNGCRQIWTNGNDDAGGGTVNLPKDEDAVNEEDEGGGGYSCLCIFNLKASNPLHNFLIFGIQNFSYISDCAIHNITF